MADAATQPAWEAVIGLETHVQLGTDSKIFTAASTTFGDDPNTHIDPVVCGLPGTLPVLNQKVLEYAVKAAMALNLNIAEHSKFDRKQYFYPDLPKNYQISQYDQPIAEEGWIEVEVAEKGKDTYLKTIGIERLHMCRRSIPMVFRYVSLPFSATSTSIQPSSAIGWSYWEI